MNNCSTGNNYSARSRRSYQKQPVYTSDKRAKFTQRENKKWIRFLTVLGYIFFVSLPALSLSVYYIYVWDPNYVAKNESFDHPAKYFDTIKSSTPEHDRNPRSEDISDSLPLKEMINSNENTPDPNLSDILREGAKSLDQTNVPPTTGKR